MPAWQTGSNSIHKSIRFDLLCSDLRFAPLDPASFTKGSVMTSLLGWVFSADLTFNPQMGAPLSETQFVRPGKPG